MAADARPRVMAAHVQPQVTAADTLLLATEVVAAMRRPAVTVVVDPPTVAAVAVRTVAEVGRTVVVAAADMGGDITLGFFLA